MPSVEAVTVTLGASMSAVSPDRDDGLGLHAVVHDRGRDRAARDHRVGEHLQAVIAGRRQIEGATPDERVASVRGTAHTEERAGPGTASRASARPELAALTEREREVLLLVGRGRSNQEIAAEPFISPHTAKTHVNRIMTKVYAHDRAQLVILAHESGMLVPGS